jgi:hypothetical protein
MAKKIQSEFPLPLERLYAKVGISYWLGAAVTSVILAGPGFVVFLTGEASAWASNSLITVYRPFSNLVWIFSFLMLHKELRDRTVNTCEVLMKMGCLENSKGKSWLKAIFSSNRELVGLLAGIFYTVFFVLNHFVLGSTPYISFQYAIYVTVGTLVWWSLFGVLVVHIAGCVWLIHRIGSTTPVRTYSFAHNLGSLGRLGLFATLSWILPLSVLIPIMIPEAGPLNLVIPALLTLAAVALVIFFASLFPLHRALVKFRDAKLDENLAEFDRLNSLYFSSLKEPAKDKAELSSIGDQLSVLVQLQARVLNRFESWPVDFSTFYQIIVISLLPLLSSLFLKLAIAYLMKLPLSL